jgi:alpha-N-arabinofuranosidase
VSFDAGEYVQGDIRLPRLDAVAAKDANGKLWIAVTNIDGMRPATVAIAVEGKRMRAARGETLAAPHLDSVNTFDAPHTVEPKAIAARVEDGKVVLHVPPASVTVVGLE